MKNSSKAIILIQQYPHRNKKGIVLNQRKGFKSLQVLKRAEKIIRTVISPVAALTPASPNIAVAASVTRAVAAIFTTLRPTTRPKIRDKI